MKSFHLLTNVDPLAGNLPDKYCLKHVPQSAESLFIVDTGWWEGSYHYSARVASYTCTQAGRIHTWFKQTVESITTGEIKYETHKPYVCLIMYN